MKAPPGNETPEAIELRCAAADFAKGLHESVSDDFDTRGQRRNTRLLKAAIAYANRVASQESATLSALAEDLKRVVVHAAATGTFQTEKLASLIAGVQRVARRMGGAS